MLYKPLKLMVIAATIFVWLRLFVGTAEVLRDPNQSFIDDRAIATQKISD